MFVPESKELYFEDFWDDFLLHYFAKFVCIYLCLL